MAFGCTDPGWHGAGWLEAKGGVMVVAVVGAGWPGGGVMMVVPPCPPHPALTTPGREGKVVGKEGGYMGPCGVEGGQAGGSR